MTNDVNSSENQGNSVDVQTGVPGYDQSQEAGRSVANLSNDLGGSSTKNTGEDKSKDGNDNKLKVKPAKDGGVNVKMNGQTVHLTPGTSLTIDSDGNVEISTNKVQPEVKPSAFPMAHGPYAFGYGIYQQGVPTGVPGYNPSDVNSLHSRMKTGDSFRNAYEKAGVDSTANAVGKSQTDYLQGQVDKQNQQSQQLNVGKGAELENA